MPNLCKDLYESRYHNYTFSADLSVSCHKCYMVLRNHQQICILNSVSLLNLLYVNRSM